MPRGKGEGITKIAVKGFKSIAEECEIDIRPLTILAGANSSGKSSIMQPTKPSFHLMKLSEDFSNEPPKALAKSEILSGSTQIGQQKNNPSHGSKTELPLKHIVNFPLDSTCVRIG